MISFAGPAIALEQRFIEQQGTKLAPLAVLAVLATYRAGEASSESWAISMSSSAIVCAAVAASTTASSSCSVSTASSVKPLPQPEITDSTIALKRYDIEAIIACVLDLSNVRQAAEVTQMELAAAMNTTQGQISRIERQSDMLLSTLSAYLTALGVDAQIVLEIGDETMTYNLTPGRTR